MNFLIFNKYLYYFYYLKKNNKFKFFVLLDFFYFLMKKYISLGILKRKSLMYHQWFSFYQHSFFVQKWWNLLLKIFYKFFYLLNIIKWFFWQKNQWIQKSWKKFFRFFFFLKKLKRRTRFYIFYLYYYCRFLYMNFRDFRRSSYQWMKILYKKKNKLNEFILHTIPEQFISLESRKKLYYFFQKKIKKFFFLIKKNFNKKFFFHYFILMFKRVKSILFQSTWFQSKDYFDFLSYFFLDHSFDTLWKWSKKKSLKKEEKKNWFFFLSLLQSYFYRFDFFLLRIFNFLSLSKIRFLIHHGYFFVNGSLLKNEKYFLSNYSFIEISKGFENVFIQWYIFSLKLYFDELLKFSHKNHFLLKTIFYKKLFFFIKKWMLTSQHPSFLCLKTSYQNFIWSCFQFRHSWDVFDYYKFKGLYFLKDFFFNFQSIDSFFQNLCFFLFFYYSFFKNKDDKTDSLIEFYEQNNYKFFTYYQKMNRFRWLSPFFRKRRSFSHIMNLFFFFSDSWHDFRVFNLLVFYNFFSLYFFLFRKKWFFYLYYNQIFFLDSSLERNIVLEQKKSFFYLTSFFYLNISYL
jgi:hypothetical protein